LVMDGWMDGTIDRPASYHQTIHVLIAEDSSTPISTSLPVLHTQLND